MWRAPYILTSKRSTPLHYLPPSFGFLQVWAAKKLVPWRKVGTAPEEIHIFLRCLRSFANKIRNDKFYQIFRLGKALKRAISGRVKRSPPASCGGLIPKTAPFSVLTLHLRFNPDPVNTIPRFRQQLFPVFLRASPVCFFIGEFSQKFDLKNVISTNTKDFSWEKWSKFAKYRKVK